MSEQAWQRRPAGGGAPSRAAPAASKSPSSASRAAAARSRGADRVSSAMAPTAASNGKKIASKQPSAEEGEASRWRALRQSVHVRATVDASARTRQTARIADLCEEDRDKVAQLIRRVVEVRLAVHSADIPVNPHTLTLSLSPRTDWDDPRRERGGILARACDAPERDRPAARAGEAGRGRDRRAG